LVNQEKDEKGWISLVIPTYMRPFRYLNTHCLPKQKAAKQIEIQKMPMSLFSLMQQILLTSLGNNHKRRQKSSNIIQASAASVLNAAALHP
jgi:hypothetical protein